MTPIDQSVGYQNLSEHLRNSAVARVFGLLALALALQIPIGMIDGTIGEREGRREEAIRSVTNTWGGHQVVRGPFLVIPYVVREETKGEVSEIWGHRYALPEELRIDGDLTTEVRRRGIFDVPLYLGHLNLSGALRLPAPDAFPPRAMVQWERASLVLAVSDPKALRDDAMLTWGEAAVPMQPGVGGFQLFDCGISAAVPLTGGEAGTLVSFALDLHLAGSGGMSLLPAGRESTIHLRSNAPDPSFVGAYSPATRSVTAAGFEATWRVPHLARNFPSAWNAGDVSAHALDDSLLGVTLFPPVDAYRSTQRAVKYDLLFIGLTFLAFFVFEVSGGLRVSAVQYLLVGLALCLFYLLLLSLAEHVGFASAYVIAAAAITSMVAAYSRAVLASRQRMAAVAALVGSLYAYLYVLLQLEDFALLAGSLGLFAILAAVMYLTRNVNWYTAPLGAEA